MSEGERQERETLARIKKPMCEYAEAIARLTTRDGNARSG